MVEYEKLTVAELKKTAAYKKIPPFEKKSSAGKARLISLLRRYEKDAGRRRSTRRRSVRRRPRRVSRSRKRASARRGKTVAQMRVECREQGLVYDTVTKRCRESKKGVPGRAPRSRRRTSVRKRKTTPTRRGKTVAQMRADCREQGLVYDAVTKECRESKKGVPGRAPRSRRRASVGRRKMRVPPSARRTPPRRRAAERKTGDCIERSNLPLSEHQIKVARYLEDHHGVIAVHGIGTGKTLTAVATAECFLDKFPDAKVIVISPSALIANFKKGMEEYGLEPDSRKYEFYSFKSFESKLNLAAYCAGNLLIVDEAHNLRTLVVGKKGKRAAQVINCARAVKRVLLLTATPFVNESMDLNNLVAMAKGTDPLTKTQWKNMYSDDQTRRGYLNCLFSVYFREQGDANYPRRVDKEIELEMDPEYLDEYLAIEEASNEKLEEMGIQGSGAFLSAVRISLLKLKNSAKCNFVVDEVSKKVREGKKVVVYSNFVGVGVKSIGKQLAERGIVFYEFTGATPARTRSKYVADYNSGKVKALLITKAAGEGLDLKGTNAIFILDPPWNEATLEQAIGRAIRYKSHAALPKDQRYVEVYTMFSVKPAEYMRQNPTAKGSADSMIKDMIDRKKAENKEVIESLGQYSIENNDCRSPR